MALGGGLEDRRECATGTAPTRPEIQEHDAFLGHHVLEVVRGDLSSRHISLAWLERVILITRGKTGSPAGLSAARNGNCQIHSGACVRRFGGGDSPGTSDTSG